MIGIVATTGDAFTPYSTLDTSAIVVNTPANVPPAILSDALNMLPDTVFNSLSESINNPAPGNPIYTPSTSTMVMWIAGGVIALVVVASIFRGRR